MNNKETTLMKFCTEYLYSEYNYDTFSHNGSLSIGSLNTIIDYLIIGSELNPDKVNENNYSKMISGFMNVFKYHSRNYETNIPYEIVNKYIPIMVESIPEPKEGVEVSRTRYSCLSNGKEIKLYVMDQTCNKIEDNKDVNEFIINKYRGAYSVLYIVNEMLYSEHKYDGANFTARHILPIEISLPNILTALCLCDKDKVNNHNLEILLKVFEDMSPHMTHVDMYDTTALKNYLDIDKEFKGKNVTLMFNRVDGKLVVKVTGNYIFNTKTQPHQNTNLSDYGYPQHTNHDQHNSPFYGYNRLNTPPMNFNPPPQFGHVPDNWCEPRHGYNFP